MRRPKWETLNSQKKKKTKGGGWKPYWDRKTSIQETKDGGICLYCGKEIDVWKLKNTEIDHIIPQSKWANDSFNNLTLTHPECNQIKGEKLPFYFFQKYRTKKEWKTFTKTADNLYKTRNPFKHKFLTLGEKENWEEELEDFVSRNLNDTRMIATYLKRYVRNELDKKAEYKKTKVQSIKGSLTSYFRKQIFDRGSVFHYKEHLRSLTPYHHAIDAIVLAHFKTRGYIQLLEYLTKINQGKRKLKKQQLTQKQFDSLSREIIEKWKRPEWELKKHELLDEYTKNAIKILENAIKQKKEVDNSKFFPIPNLKNIVEQRIPVQIEKYSIHKQEEKEEIKEVIIEVKKVLTESEYYENIKDNLKDKRGNIHYPYVSYAPDHKIKKEFIASERAGYRKKGGKILPDICEKIGLSKKISLSKLVEKIGLEKLSEYGEEYNFMIIEDKKKHYTIWDTSKYAGFGLRNDNKAERVKNINLIQKKKKGDKHWLTKNYQWLVRPQDIFTLVDTGDLDSELKKLINLPLIYTGTTGDRVSSIEIVGLVKKKNSKEVLQHKYPDYGDKTIVKNKVNSLGTKEKSIKKITPSLKLLKIDILGKKKK